MFSRRADGRNIEYAAIEAGKFTKDKYGAKYISDRMKLAKTLRDMLTDVRNYVSDKEKATVHGVLQSKLKVEFSRMHFFGNNVAVWIEDEKKFAVEPTFSKSSIKKYLQLLVRTHRCRV